MQMWARGPTTALLRVRERAQPPPSSPGRSSQEATQASHAGRVSVTSHWLPHGDTRLSGAPRPGQGEPVLVSLHRRWQEKRREASRGREGGVPKVQAVRKACGGREAIKTFPTDRLAPNPGALGLCLLDLSSGDMLGKPGSPRL